MPIARDRYLRFSLIAAIAIVLGCSEAGNIPAPEGSATRAESPPEEASSRGRGREDDIEPSDVDDTGTVSNPRFQFEFFQEPSPAEQVFGAPSDDAAEAVEYVGQVIRRSTEFGPTLVVWIFDQTDSAHQLIVDAKFGAKRLYQEILIDTAAATAADSVDRDRLQTAIIAFAEDAEFVLGTATGDGGRVIEAFDRVHADSATTENTFAALTAAWDRYRFHRITDGRELIFVMITDEAGDDWRQVDPLIDELRKYAVPCYVIGPPAVFGRTTVTGEVGEGGVAAVDSEGEEAAVTLRRGPASRRVELVSLALPDGEFAAGRLESGFGPFALEWLCRATGGRYLQVKPSATFPSETAIGSWPAVAAQSFDPAIMREYSPDYVNANQYAALIAENGARESLIEAAGFLTIEVMSLSQREFPFRDPADLSRRLTEAQRDAAKLSPMIDPVYQMLARGQRDRETLAGLRWQATYDLTMGRVLAVKARVDGYNAMLAALKRGRSFENDESTVWVLAPHADAAEAGTVIERLVADAREYLEQVVQQHAGTPWAYLAEQELATPLGWKWNER